MKIFFVGFMASGKIAFAKKIAIKLGYPHIDLDKYMEAKYRAEVKEIYRTNGEVNFRKIEQHCLIEIMAKDDIVISTGGSTPCSLGNMDLMNQEGITIYIRQGSNCLYRRLTGAKKYRPLIESMSHFQLVEYIETSLEKRKPCYEQAKYNVLGKNLRTQKLLSIINKER